MKHPKRWWGIRHMRFYYNAFMFDRWWNRFGRHLGMVPNARDTEYLEAIWRGDR